MSTCVYCFIDVYSNEGVLNLEHNMTPQRTKTIQHTMLPRQYDSLLENDGAKHTAAARLKVQQPVSIRDMEASKAALRLGLFSRNSPDSIAFPHSSLLAVNVWMLGRFLLGARD